MWKYLYKWLEQKPVAYKEKLRYRLALAYTIVAWHAFIYVYYLGMQEFTVADVATQKSVILKRAKERNENVKYVQITGLKVENVTEIINNPSVINQDDEEHES